MSCQKGNATRSRPQKYKNHFAFKNNLHDKTVKTKIINDIKITNVCERCKEKLEWRIKYKKYKIQNAPSKCVKCQQKTVKHSYHTMCTPCSEKNSCCPKCGTKGPLVVSTDLNKTEQQKFDNQVQQLLKNLPERKRRTFLRFAQNAGKGESEEPVSQKDIIESLQKLVLECKGSDDLDDDLDDFNGSNEEDEDEDDSEEE